ncbi:MAG: hypothetical protein ACXWQO_10250 [Bdellovibrionota bacterium]
MKIFLLLSFLAFSAHAANLKITGNVVNGCEGEGCDCTRSKLTESPFTLYARMNKKSKVLGKYPHATKANAIETYTLIVKPGRAKVLKVRDANKPEKIPMKAGDELSHIFDHGEGHYTALWKSQQVDYFDEQLKLEIIDEGKHEAWTKMKVGKLSGYTPGFPFFGCLE